MGRPAPSRCAQHPAGNAVVESRDQRDAAVGRRSCSKLSAVRGVEQRAVPRGLVVVDAERSAMLGRLGGIRSAGIDALDELPELAGRQRRGVERNEPVGEQQSGSGVGRECTASTASGRRRPGPPGRRVARRPDGGGGRPRSSSSRSRRGRRRAGPDASTNCPVTGERALDVGLLVRRVLLLLLGGPLGDASRARGGTAGRAGRRGVRRTGDQRRGSGATAPR